MSWYQYRSNWFDQSKLQKSLVVENIDILTNFKYRIPKDLQNFNYNYIIVPGINGLKDESSSAGYKPFAIVEKTRVPINTRHRVSEVIGNWNCFSVIILNKGRHSKISTKAMTSDSRLITNDSIINCMNKFHFPAPTIFFTLTSFARRLALAVVRFT